MLIFTVCLTLALEAMMLAFVFYGYHFYIGVGLCTYILYLLLSLGFGNPGFAHEEYEAMQFHRDLENCDSSCRHGPSLRADFPSFCG